MRETARTFKSDDSVGIVDSRWRSGGGEHRGRVLGGGGRDVEGHQERGAGLGGEAEAR